MSAVAASSASAAPVAGADSASGSKRPREPTAAEVEQTALLDAVFSRANSRVITRALHNINKADGSSAGTDSNKKAKQRADESASSAKPATRNPFVALMDSAAAASSSTPALTANGAVTLASTDSACLDLFYHLARGYSREDTCQALAAAWKENPETTLKILCHARDCHGEGKGEKLIVYYALIWLRENKPKTYLANLLTFVRHGYFKDLVQIVDMLDNKSWAPPPPPAGKGKHGSCRKVAAATAAAVKSGEKTIGDAFVDDSSSSSLSKIGSSQFELRLYAEVLKADSLKLKKWRQQRKAWAAHQKAVKEAAAAKAEDAASAAKSTADSAAKPAQSKPPTASSWFDDEDEPVLSDDEWELCGDEEEPAAVGEARAKVGQMKIRDDYMTDAAASSAAAATPADSAAVPMDAEDTKEKVPSSPVEPPNHCYISLAAKWAPSERKHFGRQAHKLARILFAGDVKAKGGEHAHGGFVNKEDQQRCLKKYRSLLSTLRAHLCITEHLICHKKWEKVNFNAVPSKCHQLLKKAFVKHCGERYSAYLQGLKKGVGKINVKGTAPHELIGYYLNTRNPECNETVEAAWRTLVDKVKETGTFSSAVAVVDVSGSMSGIPMLVAIAMGLLVAEVTTGPFAGRVITFESRPQWHTIQGDTLLDRVKCLSSAPWGGSTNFQAIFDLILDVAVTNKVPQEHLPQTLFCFSDMQFDEASPDFLESNFDAVKGKFTSAGYTLPNIVFWNLNGALNKDAPVNRDTPGVALMAGFSAALLNVFLRAEVAPEPAEGAAAAPPPEKDPLNPINIMMASIQDYSVEVDESER